jgi:hypothetical protein
VSLFRLTGKVEARTDRPWSKGERSGVIPQADVRVNEWVVTQVSLADALKDGIVQGQDVDLIVEVVSQGGYLRAQGVGYWPTETTAKRHAAA